MESSTVHIGRSQIKAVRDSLTEALRKGHDIVIIQFEAQPSMIHVTANREDGVNRMITYEGGTSD